MVKRSKLHIRSLRAARPVNDIASIIAVVCLFALPFAAGIEVSTTWLIVSGIVAYLGGFMGTFAHHRYFTHGAFKTTKFWEYIFLLFITTFNYRCVVGYADMHLRHHAGCGTEEDLHSVELYGWRAMYYKPLAIRKNHPRIKYLMSKPHVAFSYYFGHWATVLWAAVTLCFGLEAFFFLWVVPVAYQIFVLFPCSIYLIHKWGYQNFPLREKNDDSVNVPWLFPILLGECWHNNHHARPAAAHYGVKWWEFDPNYYFVKLIRTDK